MPSISDALANLKLALALVAESTYPTLFTTIGLILIGLSAYYSYVVLKQEPTATPRWQKTLLFSSLGAGLALVVAGGATALLNLFDNPIKRIDPAIGIANLRENKEVEWLIRLIPYRPDTERYLSISELQTLGPPQLKYVFVAAYDELRGYKVSDAITMVGGDLQPEQRVSAIIFRVKHIYPANVRGLMQILRKLEHSVIPEDGTRIIEQNTFSEREKENLQDDDAIGSWAWDSYNAHYETFCRIAQKFRCDSNYTAHKLISTINGDWHPVGFSRIKKINACYNKFDVCKYKDWADVTKDIKNDFGARVFLIDNLEIKYLGARYLIDFDQPRTQVIPEIGPSK